MTDDKTYIVEQSVLEHCICECCGRDNTPIKVYDEEYYDLYCPDCGQKLEWK